MSSGTVYRQLTFSELVRDRCKLTGPCMTANMTKFICDIDIIENKNTFEKSINCLKQMHPILRCKIQKDSLDDTKYNYVFESDEILNKNENIKYFYYKGDKKDEDKFLEYFYEYIINTQDYDTLNTLLWYFKVIKLTNENNKSRYCIIQIYRHVIADGPNIMAIFLELLFLFEKFIYNNNTIDSIGDNSNEEYRLDDPRVIKIDENLNGDPEIDFPIKPIDALKIEINNRQNIEHINSSLFTFDEDDKEFISFKDIIKLRENFNSILKVFKIENTIYEILINQCNRNNVKLINFFYLIIALALKELVKKLDKNNDFLIRSRIPVNMRLFFDPPISYRVMGFYIHPFTETFETELDFDIDSKNFFNKFWSVAKQKTDNFQNFLNKKEFMEKKSFEEIEKSNLIFYKNQNKKTSPNVRHTYVCTCISGKFNFLIPQFLTIDGGSYGGHFFKKNQNEWAAHSILIGKYYLRWTIAFNKCNISETNVELWIEEIQKIINKIISNTSSKLS